MNREYYVYEYWRLDNNTCFYVGKGKGGRWLEIYPSKRSKHFLRVLDKTECAVIIVEDSLTEEQALALEQDLIHQYVFEEGYSINIKGYGTRAKGYLVNCTWGGEGTSGNTKSEDDKRKMSEKHAGHKNPMYGRTGAKHPNSRKVMYLNTGEVFNCLLDAKKWAGIKSNGGISSVCKGKRKTTGKHPATGEPLKWKYVD